MRIPSLKSERLVLRAPQPKDAPAIEQYFAKEDVVKYLARVPYPYPKGGAIQWIERQSLGLSGMNMAITLDDSLIGVVSIRASSERDLGVFAPTIGYWLAPPFWGKGFMQEAVKRLLDWYLPLEPTERICAAAFEDNERSLKVLTNLGFTEVGRGKTFSEARGEDVPQISMELTADRYLQCATPQAV